MKVGIVGAGSMDMLMLRGGQEQMQKLPGFYPVTKRMPRFSRKNSMLEFIPLILICLMMSILSIFVRRPHLHKEYVLQAAEAVAISSVKSPLL